MLGLSFTGLMLYEQALLRPNSPRLFASSTTCITMSEAEEETGQKGKATAPSLLGQKRLCLFNQFLTCCGVVLV